MEALKGELGIWLLPHSQTTGLGMRLVMLLMDMLMFQVGSIAAGSGRGCVPPGHGAPAQEGEGEDS